MTSYNIYSWNINGIRSVLNKGALQSFLKTVNPDILCLQETKAKKDQAEVDLPEYEELWNSAARPGYSGTAIFSKPAVLSSFNGFTDDLNISCPWQEDSHGNPLLEGRVLTAEYKQFYLVTVYTPNSKRELTRLSLRHDLWDPAFLKFLKQLELKKPVVVCGDFNAAHQEIDLARPKENSKNAGFTKEERKGITNYLDAGLIDTFRFLHPEDRRYTWWTHWGNARAKNIGWRIDYFLISASLEKNLIAADIHEDFLGSDHCPISIRLEF